MLTPEEINKVRQDAGAKPLAQVTRPSLSSRLGIEKISTTVPTEAEPKGFIERVGSSFKERGEKLSESFEKTQKREITGPELSLRTAGAVAGGAVDIVGEAFVSGFRGAKKIAQALTPDPIEDFVVEKAKEVGRSFLESDIGKKAVSAIESGTEEFNKFKEENPRAYRNLAAAANIADLVISTKAISPAEKTTKVSAKKGAAEVLEESAEKSIRKEKESFARKLIRPEQTKKVKEAQVARTTEIGKGPFKRSIIEPTKLEKQAEEAILKVKGVSSKKTAQQNFNVIQKANVGKAEKLISDIKANDFVIPKREVTSRLSKAQSALQDSPLIVGDAERTAGKLLKGAEKIIAENKGTGSGLLKSRKDYDAWVRTQKPKVFDANAENAFTTANREIRSVFNDLLEEKAPSLGIKKSLREQSSLFNAMKTIEKKAATEADTAALRFLQKMGDTLGIKSKAVQIVAASAGIGGLGAAATFAPAVAGLGGVGFLTYKAGKLVMNPKVRTAIATAITEIDKVLAQSGISATKRAALEAIKAEAERLPEQLEGLK